MGLFRYTPSIEEARRDIRYFIAEARKHDSDYADGVRGVVDSGRLAIARAWRDYRRAQAIARQSEDDTI